ncbi:MAG TPA: hypothetical protein VMV46_10785 [Thermoanaerobaculia bacterium]|nr:hypothetical protein [Thermoanaerobaculia bacterium]
MRRLAALAARQRILEVEGETIVVAVGAEEIAEGGTFVELADDRAVEAGPTTSCPTPTVSSPSDR